MSSQSQLVWLITGTSSGLGRELALAALKRGDKVIATARERSMSKLDDLRTQGANALELDVTAPLNGLREVAAKAIELYGRVGVLVNNAGYIQTGTLEECTPEESIEQFNANVFGPLNVSRAFLPYMRERQAGTIIFVGSIGSWKPFPTSGIYTSTKLAIRGLSETLNAEISPFGLRSICFEFGFFRTNFMAPDHRTPYQPRITDYNPMTEEMNKIFLAVDRNQPGDPVKGVELVIDVIKNEGIAKGKTFPTVLALGSDTYDLAKGTSELTLKRLEEWKDLTQSTDFPKTT
ncbi:NAD(P)-binding protein [Leucogyrophana mollusca]|uniref:NAD(P)-binding protein n=1 Tax=Leucogyrophana mollusca TaxID=85980 RepID=A0ACB8BDC2_9AGAM|nr:NAD(P)-binding protein [Leucogyrophana mollusca]